MCVLRPLLPRTPLAALIISADLRSLPAESKAILLNTAAIAVDQDELGKMGRLMNKTGAKSALPCCYNMHCATMNTP